MLTRSNPKFDFIEHTMCVRVYKCLSACVLRKFLLYLPKYGIFPKQTLLLLLLFGEFHMQCGFTGSKFAEFSNPIPHECVHMNCVCASRI